PMPSLFRESKRFSLNLLSGRASSAQSVSGAAEDRPVPTTDCTSGRGMPAPPPLASVRPSPRLIGWLSQTRPESLQWKIITQPRYLMVTSKEISEVPDVLSFLPDAV